MSNNYIKIPFVLAASGLICNVYAQKSPNIILIMTDQQRFDALGCMDNPSVISPNIDQLAREGTVFSNAYSSCPSSTPARAGLLTGMSPWHHGMLGYGAVAEKYKYEMPQMMHDNHFYTFGIGKMHWHPQRILHGFDGTLLDEGDRVEEKGFVSDYHQWFKLQCPAGNPNVTGIGWNEHHGKAYALAENLHPTYWTGETAFKFINNYDFKGEPLFLKVSFIRPHSPYDPPKRFVDMYKGKSIPAPYIGDWCGEYSKLLDLEKVSKDAAFGNFGDEYAEQSRLYYYANVTFVDEEVGHIIKMLKEKGVYDNTLILFTSDHGDMLGDHYHWRKTYPYESSSHIPFIVKWPKSFNISSGDVKEVVELRDVLPTFLDVCGDSVPKDIDGKSVLPLAKGDVDGWRPYIDLEHATCYSKDNYWAALTDGKIKYIWNFHNGSEMLFDLQKDPHELHNAVADKKYKKTLKKWHGLMVQHLSERGEDFVKDGQLVIRKQTMLYGPNFPKLN